jgi:hypothetical protein
VRDNTVILRQRERPVHEFFQELSQLTYFNARG